MFAPILNGWIMERHLFLDRKRNVVEIIWIEINSFVPLKNWFLSFHNFPDFTVQFTLAAAAADASPFRKNMICARCSLYIILSWRNFQLVPLLCPPHNIIIIILSKCVQLEIFVDRIRLLVCVWVCVSECFILIHISKSFYFCALESMKKCRLKKTLITAVHTFADSRKNDPFFSDVGLLIPSGAQV